MNAEAGRFVDRICADVLGSAAVHHPYLEAFATGALPDFAWALRDFAYQYGHYSAGFAGYVAAVIDKLQAPEHQQILATNLAEEQGAIEDVVLSPELSAEIAGRPHSSLFADFQAAAGVDAPYLETAQPGAVSGSWQQRFMSLCQLSESTGVGAIGIGTELIVSRVYQQILAGLEVATALNSSQRVFFQLHSDCDEEHAAQLLLIATELASDPRTRPQLEYGARTAIQLRIAFWDEMLERAQAMPVAAQRTLARAN